VSRPDWRPTASIETLRLRARMLHRAREYFATTGALEVETPILVRNAVTDVHLESLEVRGAGGAHAGFLHTSPEYAMKRLLCAGAPDIYQVSHVFRDGERGRFHNPEFTMIEWYRLGIDHHALMTDVEQLLLHMLDGLVRPAASGFVAYRAAFEASLGVDPVGVRVHELATALTARGADVPAALAGERDALCDLGLSLYVAPSFPADRLTFLHDFPASQAALARIEGSVAARFEAFWGAVELANGFDELGDAAEQATRFSADAAQRARTGRPSRAPDDAFLGALEAGLPRCSGVALGFDRVVMIAAGARHIDEVVAFPAERA
jgi:elongation factor P--(R)-beta-lysine ligase